VLDASPVVRLGTQLLDEVRRRVQQDTLGRRGHRDDPLDKIRGLLRHGAEHLTDRQVAKLTPASSRDPNHEVTVAWSAYPQLRTAYATQASNGRHIAEKIIASFPSCPIGEVTRPGRTLRQSRSQVLACFDTSGVSNGGTEAITCSSRRPAAWPTASATSTTTAHASCSSPTDHAPYRHRPNHA
jgi:transposase